jgi:hypothetical protein
MRGVMSVITKRPNTRVSLFTQDLRIKKLEYSLYLHVNIRPEMKGVCILIKQYDQRWKEMLVFTQNHVIKNE